MPTKKPFPLHNSQTPCGSPSEESHPRCKPGYPLPFSTTHTRPHQSVIIILTPLPDLALTPSGSHNYFLHFLVNVILAFQIVQGEQNSLLPSLLISLSLSASVRLLWAQTRLLRGSRLGDRVSILQVYHALSPYIVKEKRWKKIERTKHNSRQGCNAQASVARKCIHFMHTPHPCVEEKTGSLARRCAFQLSVQEQMIILTALRRAHVEAKY